MIELTNRFDCSTWQKNDQSIFVVSQNKMRTVCGRLPSFISFSPLSFIKLTSHDATLPENVMFWHLAQFIKHIRM